MLVVTCVCLSVCMLKYTLLQKTKPLRLHASGESQNFSKHGLWRSRVLKVHLANNTAETKTEEQTPLTDLTIQWLEQYRLPQAKLSRCHCLYNLLLAWLACVWSYWSHWPMPTYTGEGQCMSRMIARVLDPSTPSVTFLLNYFSYPDPQSLWCAFVCIIITLRLCYA